MIEYDKGIKEVYTKAKIRCDICLREANVDDFDFEEFISIRNTGGYTSAFGEGTAYELDICDRCLKEKLGEYIRIVE